LSQVDHVEDVEALFDQLINLVVRLARHGLIHCDLNEFNLMLCDKERPVLIDLPQMVSVDHSNAAQLFDRDINCLRAFFRRRFHFETETVPVLSDVRRVQRLDVQVEASGYIRPKRTSRQDQGEQKEIEEEKEEETIELEEGCADLCLTGNRSGNRSGDPSETSSNDSAEESEDDQEEKKEEELSIRSLSTNEKKPMSSEDVRRRLMRQQRSKANKKKLRVKGKAVAIGQARRSNNAVIREAVTDALWA